MNTLPKSAEQRGSDCRDQRRRPRASATHAANVVVLGAVLLMAPLPARAVDGCVVLLCLAAPSWRIVPQCVPPIRQLFRDLARGKAFPTCAMSSGGNSATHGWSTAPTYCPPQYTRTWDGPHGPVYTCDYDGAISVTVNGEPFARTWWSMAGDSVTDFSPSAKRQLGTWDARFDAEYAAWLATRPAVPPDPAR
jgi:hypothetical protein